VLNSERGGNLGEDEEDVSLPPAELSTMRKRRSRMLHGLVEDARSRTIDRIGEHVFNRIYDLMSSIMYAPVSEHATADMAALSATVSERELMVINLQFLISLPLTSLHSPCYNSFTPLYTHIVSALLRPRHTLAHTHIASPASL
jgi:hypothetical protein